VSAFLRRQKSSFTLAFAFGLLALAAVFTACNSPMGMGPVVDTESPTIFINSPTDNYVFGQIAKGDPITIEGNSFDDVGVVSLRFEIYDRTNSRRIEPSRVDYQIFSDGRWQANIFILEEGEREYNIKVIAQDKFGNEGASDVSVQIEIIPPWITNAWVVRHPNSGFTFDAPLYQMSVYEKAGYQLPEAYRNIQYLNDKRYFEDRGGYGNFEIDHYQNETFTLKVVIDPAKFSGVAASRLFIKYDRYNYLHGEAFANGLEPTRLGGGQNPEYYPEWDITAAQLKEWRDSFSSESEAQYIFFEVWAWGNAAWDGTKPIPGKPERRQQIPGTVWYPESDLPHVYIDPANIVNEIITIEPGDALSVEFYDDDRLGEIYTLLLRRQDFETERTGYSTEEAYFAALANPADAAKRNALIAKYALENRFVVQPGTDNRWRSLLVPTTGLSQGEYRLIALAKDNKSESNYSFEPGAVAKWGIYPPVKVQIQSASAPLVIVENPEKENIFPNLSAGGGENFTMSGYTLGKFPTEEVLIAWVPKTLQNNGLQAALTVLESSTATDLPRGDSFTAANGIKVWKLSPVPAGETVINNSKYFRANFSQTFNIVSDFQYILKSPVPPRTDKLENDDKLFVIYAVSSENTPKTFNLSGLTVGPYVEVTSHGQGAGHDPTTDLVLKMRVSPGSYGVKVQIPDPPQNADNQIYPLITDTDSAGVGAKPFAGPTTLSGGEWQRTVPANAYDEGTKRTYRFSATDILGNPTPVERLIDFSTKPLLESITCTNGAGTYGIGETLRFEAMFSMPVNVVYDSARFPRLKLYLTNPGNATNVATTRYANFDASAARGTAVFFTYTVQEGDSTDLLYTALDAIDLNSSSITSYKGDPARIVFGDHVNSLQTKTPVKLDAARPVIRRASFKTFTGYNANGISYFTKGRTITLELRTSEPVIISGNPIAVIRYGTNPLYAQFSSKIASSPGEILTFTHTVADSVNTSLTRLEWGDPWLGFLDTNDSYLPLNTANNITDMVGNPIVTTGYGTNGNAAYLEDANRWGQATTNPSYISEQGYIKTSTPPTPSYTLNGSGGTDSILTNSPVQLSVTGREILTGVAPAKLYYSRGGSDEVEIPGSATGGTATITESSANTDRYSTNYVFSQYTVTAWQEDLAGNKSGQAPQRQVTINSRWPELTGMDMSVPDGSYPAGQAITFRMNFSGRVRTQAGASVTLNLRGTSAGKEGTAVVTGTPTTEGNGFSYLLSVNWTVPGNIAQTMQDIKATSIAFTNVQDEYGNVLREYSGTTAESASNSNRPIADAGQLDRPGVEIRSARPHVVAANPMLPGTGQYSNGGIITLGSGKQFTLTFDTDVSKVSGKYITVRPYGQWAIPPVLSPDDFNALYNATTNETYKKRLKSVDMYGVPPLDSIRGNASAYNSYIETTNGVTSIPSTNGYVRPDTTAKWVLAFDIDPYTTAGASDRTALLREVFTAAGWKQQRIPISQVGVSGSVVTVTLNEELLPGRIWEVELDDGAFQDAAGNPSVGINNTYSYNGSGPGYRFWSPGTAAPVIRVDRITYDGRLAYPAGDGGDARRQANANLSFINTTTNRQQIPPIDTKVRIDCETPGASIRYDVIRTAYNFAVVDGAVVNNLNPVLGGTNATNDNAFFGNVQHITGWTDAGTTTGYQRNTIGNENRDSSKDANGFFNRLLVPNVAQPTVPLSNGTFLISELTDIRNTLRTSGGGSAYRTVSNAGAVTYNTPGANNFIYIGDAYGTAVNTVNAHTNSALYSGRRDYVVAVAKKDSVTAGTYAGPALDALTFNANNYTSIEGVYKTTMIYRNPNANAYRLLLDGRTEVIYDGNPIPGFGMDDNPAGDIRSSIAYKTFYRIGGNLGEDPTATNRNHIFVSWEFVADIKRSRPVYYTAAGEGGPAWGGATASYDGAFISAPYGGVTYRYGGW